MQEAQAGGAVDRREEAAGKGRRAGVVGGEAGDEVHRLAAVEDADALFLEKRGALSHRGARTFSRSAVLHREIQWLRALLVHCDPRRGGMSAEMAALAARLLPEPWLIKPASVEYLALRLQEAPGLTAEAAAAGVEPSALVAAVAALSAPEKIALLDLALLEQAPSAALAERDEED